MGLFIGMLVLLRGLSLNFFKIFISGDRRPGREDAWNPNVAGLAKRDLLKDVLSVFCMFPLTALRTICSFCHFLIQLEVRHWRDLLLTGKICSRKRQATNSLCTFAFFK